MKKGVLARVITIPFLFLLCSQPNQPLDQSAPLPPLMITINGPNSLNAPAEIGQKAAEVNQWFLFVTDMLDGVEEATPQINGNIFQWELALGDGDIKRLIKAVRRSDKSVDWTVRWQGQAEDGTIYNDRTILIGKAGKNDQSQSWTFFDIVTGQETNKISWQKDVHANINLDYQFPALGGQWKLVNRSDGSGSYEFILKDARKYYAVWSADGSGTYSDYRNGTLETGSWQ